MKHIRYVSTAKTLCQDPENLGRDLVVVDRVDGLGITCRECSALLMAHNKKSYEAELAAMHNKRRTSESYGLSFAQVVITVAGFTSLFWIGFFVTLWWLLYG